MVSAPATKLPTPSISVEPEALPSSSQNRINPSSTSDPNPNSPFPAFALVGAAEDAALLPAELLSREEVLRRRSLRVKRLQSCYRDQYWALAEELRAKHREYYWTFGVSPLEEGSRAGLEEDSSTAAVEGSRDNGVVGTEFGSRCGFAGCQSKAMPLSRYCHLHILSDNRQTLYKACTFVVKSVPTGSIVCGKPVMKAAVPSLCSMHFQGAQENVSQALKKNVSTKFNPKEEKHRTSVNNIAVMDVNTKLNDIRMEHGLRHAGTKIAII